MGFFSVLYVSEYLMVCRELEQIQSRFARKSLRDGAKGVLIGGGGSRDAGVTACRLNKALHVCRLPPFADAVVDESACLSFSYCSYDILNTITTFTRHFAD